jgi:hypothetical protein
MTWLGKRDRGAFFVFDRRASKLVLAVVVTYPHRRDVRHGCSKAR